MMRAGGEHILLVSEDGAYELLPYERIAGTPEGLYAFAFTRRGKQYAVYWYQGKDCEIFLPTTDFVCEEVLGGERTPVREVSGGAVLPASHRRYLSIAGSREALEAAFRSAKIL